MHLSRIEDINGTALVNRTVKRIAGRSSGLIIIPVIALFGLVYCPVATQAQGKTTSATKGQGATSQPEGPPTAKTHPNDPMVWDVDTMMEDAVQQISRRYNLTQDQEKYTRAFLTKRVREFLDQYEPDVRELLQESINIRTGKTTDPSALADWAMRAMPVYDAATKAILDGNKEWGIILDEKQKEIHEKDLRLMDTNFANVNQTLNGWAEGKGNVRGAMGGNQKGGQVSPPIGPIGRQEIEDAWIAYVNSFIKAYNLDSAKQISAREKIHKEQLEKAKSFREANKEKFKKLDLDRRRLGGMPMAQRNKKRVELARRKRELEAPIYSFFVEMSRRLDTLPTSKQRAEISPEAKKSLEALYKKLSGEQDQTGKDAEGEDVESTESKPRGEGGMTSSQPADAKPDEAKPVAEPKASETDKPAEAPTTQKADN